MNPLTSRIVHLKYWKQKIHTAVYLERNESIWIGELGTCESFKQRNFLILRRILEWGRYTRRKLKNLQVVIGVQRRKLNRGIQGGYFGRSFFFFLVSSQLGYVDSINIKHWLISRVVVSKICYAKLKNCLFILITQLAKSVFLFVNEGPEEHGFFFSKIYIPSL